MFFEILTKSYRILIINNKSVPSVEGMLKNISSTLGQLEENM